MPTAFGLFHDVLGVGVDFSNKRVRKVHGHHKRLMHCFGHRVLPVCFHHITQLLGSCGDTPAVSDMLIPGLRDQQSLSLLQMLIYGPRIHGWLWFIASSWCSVVSTPQDITLLPSGGLPNSALLNACWGICHIDIMVCCIIT